MHCFVCDFSDCCPHLYCGKLKHVSATVSSNLPQVSLVYLGIEIIQPGKSFLNFDCWSNKAFKNYEDLIQIMTLLFFTLINPRRITRSFMRCIQIVKSNGISYSWYFFKVIYFKNNNWKDQMKLFLNNGHEKQWCHYWNKIFIVFECLVWSTIKLLK